MMEMRKWIHLMKTLETIRREELEKLTKSLISLIKFRPGFLRRPFIFLCKDALDAGIISKFEAREVLKYNNQPHNFPCFLD